MKNQLNHPSIWNHLTWRWYSSRSYSWNIASWHELIKITFWRLHQSILNQQQESPNFNRSRQREKPTCFFSGQVSQGKWYEGNQWWTNSRYTKRLTLRNATAATMRRRRTSFSSLVVATNPFEKYELQNWIISPGRDGKKKMLETEVQNCTVGKPSIFSRTGATKDTHPSSPRPPPSPPPKKTAVFFDCFNLLSSHPITDMTSLARLEESTTETHHGIDASGDLKKLHQASNQNHVSLQEANPPSPVTRSLQSGTNAQNLMMMRKSFWWTKKTRGLWPCCSTGINSVVQKQPVTNAKLYLVGGFNPSEKYSSNWIISLNRGENKKSLSCHQPVIISQFERDVELRFLTVPLPNVSGSGSFAFPRLERHEVSMPNKKHLSICRFLSSMSLHWKNVPRLWICWLWQIRYTPKD